MNHQQHPQRTKAWITNSRWYLESELPVSFDRICFLLPSYRTVFAEIQARSIFMHIFLWFLNLKHNLKKSRAPDGYLVVKAFNKNTHTDLKLGR
jgi:hypothetical protein